MVESMMNWEHYGTEFTSPWFYGPFPASFTSPYVEKQVYRVDLWTPMESLMNRIYGASKSGESAGKTMIRLDAKNGLKMSDAESKRGTVDWVKYSSNTISSYYFKGTKSAQMISGAAEGSKKGWGWNHGPPQRFSSTAPMRLRPVAHTFEIEIAAGKP